MSATAKQRAEFQVTMARALPRVPQSTIEDVSRKLLRLAATHGRLAEESCNGHPIQGSATAPIETVNRLQEKWDARIERETERVEQCIRRHAESLGLTVDFGGDPRGYTVKLQLPNGACNTLGMDGFGIPQ